jgi:L-lysine exporter family protein LysE/ArgO
MEDRSLFALGVAASSIIRFFSIAYGARLLAPLLSRKSFATGLDLFTGSLMLWIACGLLLSL